MSAKRWRVEVRKVRGDAHLFQGVRLAAWFERPDEAEQVAALLNGDQPEQDTP